MGFSLFPREVKFFELFKEQNKLLIDAAAALHGMCADPSAAADLCKRINELELAGGQAVRNIAGQLAATFITPLDREDIHALSLMQEEVLNTIKAVATRLALYQREKMQPAVKDLTEFLRQMLSETGAMLEKLSSRQLVEEFAVRIKQTKAKADAMLLVALGEVYETAGEGTVGVLDAVKWSHIYERLEDVLSKTDSLSDLLEGISIKNA